MLLKGSSKSTGKCQCIFEGEEEIGSPNLHPFIRRNRKRLNVDAAVVSDMPIPAPDMPALTVNEPAAVRCPVRTPLSTRTSSRGVTAGGSWRDTGTRPAAARGWPAPHPPLGTGPAAGPGPAAAR